MDSGFYKLIITTFIGTIAILLALLGLAITIILKL
jgi:hypothetical protein